MMSGHWALGCGHWAVGTGHLWAVGTQDRRATAVKVLTQSPHETGTSPSLQSLQDSDENSEARGRSPALSESVVLNGTSRTAWPGTEAATLPHCSHSATVTAALPSRLVPVSLPVAAEWHRQSQAQAACRTRTVPGRDCRDCAA